MVNIDRFNYTHAACALIRRDPARFAHTNRHAVYTQPFYHDKDKLFKIASL